MDPAFGTGVVKVTPGHDPNDYQAGVRNGLPMINLLNPDGTYNENAGKYAGIDRLVVRKRVVEDLKAARLSRAGRIRTWFGSTTRIGARRRSSPICRTSGSCEWADDPDGTSGFAQQAMDAVTSGRINDSSRTLCQELSRLAGRKARLVHQPPALVGTSHPDLALRQLAPRAIWKWRSPAVRRGLASR